MPELIKERVESCFQAAESYFNRSFKRPDISFKLRGQKAGVAHICENLLRFNPVLYEANREHFLLHTVAHEVAHIVSYKLYGNNIRPHGPQWQAVMQNVYQLPPHRCHNYAVQRTPRTHYLYRCGCPERDAFALSAQRHARVNKGMHYLCKACNTRLRYTHRQTKR